MVTGRTLVVHWGQSGGGTRFHKELSRAYAKADPAVAVSYALSSDQAEAMAGLRVPSFTLRTYRSRIGVLLGVPRLLVNLVRLRRFLRQAQITRVVSSMESIYQSLTIPLVLPRSVDYTTVIHDATQHPGDEHILKRLGRVLELRRANQVVTLSLSVTEGLISAGGITAGRIRTLFHPAFGEALRDSPRELPGDRSIVIGVFGRLLPYKGIDIFMDAVLTLRRQGVDVVGRVVGNGPEECLRHSDSSDVIEWRTGWVPTSEVDAVLDGFDVLALTYREASQSGVVAHAWPHALPVVATPAGALVEQVGSVGCGVVAREITSDAVADAIRAVVTDGSAYREMSAASLNAARSRGWDRFVHELRELVDG